MYQEISIKHCTVVEEPQCNHYVVCMLIVAPVIPWLTFLHIWTVLLFLVGF